jgi:hypothetical protein
LEDGKKENNTAMKTGIAIVSEDTTDFYLQQSYCNQKRIIEKSQCHKSLPVGLNFEIVAHANVRTIIGWRLGLISKVGGIIEQINMAL